MTNTKTTLNFPKFYVNKYGAFYEGEILGYYCWQGGDHYYYSHNVVIEKFIIHYDEYTPVVHFRYRHVDKKQLWTLPAERLFGY